MNRLAKVEIKEVKVKDLKPYDRIKWTKRQRKFRPINKVELNIEHPNLKGKAMIIHSLCKQLILDENDIVFVREIEKLPIGEHCVFLDANKAKCHEHNRCRWEGSPKDLIQEKEYYFNCPKCDSQNVHGYKTMDDVDFLINRIIPVGEDEQLDQVLTKIERCHKVRYSETIDEFWGQDLTTTDFDEKRKGDYVYFAHYQTIN